MIEAPRWTAEQLVRDSAIAVEYFRTERLREPLEHYLNAFDEYLAGVEALFEKTVDLTELDDAATAFLTDPRLLRATRYLTGPPISDDDLKTVAEAISLNANRLRNDPDSVRRIVEVIRVGLDRRRFPWVAENRDPTDAEKHGAMLASAALMAAQWVGTQRRSEGKSGQEVRVASALQGIGLVKVASRKVSTYADAPGPGEFCGESYLGNRKADFIVRLWDDRILPIECKVSNSATNSVKRLNNDAAAKAEAWRSDFGSRQIVPAAVLSGVYKLHNLEDAQARGLAIFWAHDLESLTDWIGATRRTP